jgi:hypothetical protein
MGKFITTYVGLAVHKDSIDIALAETSRDGDVRCRRRFKSEPPRRSNIEPGVEADFEIVGCR